MECKVTNRDKLVLGWKIDDNYNPVVLKNTNNFDFDTVKEENLVCIDPKSIGAHSCILSQSGSGKSYFLGRLLEEILLATRANLHIIDLNSDFISFFEIVPDHYWQPVNYDQNSKLGHLPTEKDTVEFKEYINSVSTFMVRTKQKFPTGINDNVDLKSLSLEWGNLYHSFFHDKRFSFDEVQLMHAAHNFAMRIIGIELFCDYPQIFAKRDFEVEVDLLKVETLVGINELDLSRNLKGKISSVSHYEGSDDSTKESLECAIEDACLLSTHVTNDSWLKYRGFLRKYNIDGVLEMKWFPSIPEERYRVKIYDIASMGNRDNQCIVIEQALARSIERAKERWRLALKKSDKHDTRVPTIIVLEEAHRIAPKKITTEGEEKCRNIVREIAAEGRKYGLFFILVSQRFDKLDSIVLGEVENLAILRLNAPQLHNEMVKCFGLEDILKNSNFDLLSMPKSRVFLYGSWTNYESVWLYCAMRRTIEGGKNLDEKYWAKPKIPE